MRGQGDASFGWDSPRHWEMIDECETTSDPEAREKIKFEYLSWLEESAKAWLRIRLLWKWPAKQNAAL